MSGNGEWCTIESDPGVFTELIRDFGVKGVQVEELYMLEEQLFEEFKPIHGLIFLFKWVPEAVDPAKILRHNDIYFAKQVIHNACATQAIINILLNCHHADIELGAALAPFKDFTQSMDPMLRGQCLNNSDQIRAVHNSFARNEVFETFGRKTDKDEDAFHFVGYLPAAGHLVELDGLAEGPIDHGVVADGADWLAMAKPIIEERMNRYAGKELRFTLLAVVSDRKLVYTRRIEELQKKNESMPSDEAIEEINQLKEQIEQEKLRDKANKIENIRRKHNFLPFIVELFKVLGDSTKLSSVYEEAAKRGQERERRNKRLKTESA
ncbi:Ubiquitin carboxyl-terminal hydrolase isozyme L5 [Hypsibius exemplaris]|uniref:Ubiquitin carboxyl-terminal hydrolase n=1 Tax=Hypsibius exemplaris TaxID=2072580 RepID=A0A1W0WKZ9_HYPEX|nr:Ubiquitin carboxyl-terminal hydrolase isozyme L5 [Hypsibius exemplaris]